MKVLVDTSIWIEFFRARPALSQASLEWLGHLLENDRAVTLYPIRSELLSGRLERGQRGAIQDIFTAIQGVDPDWNQPSVWSRIVAIAEVAHQKTLSVPGIVDRMVLVAAQMAGVSLWTLDRSLLRLAELSNVSLLAPEVRE